MRGMIHTLRALGLAVLLALTGASAGATEFAPEVPDLRLEFLSKDQERRTLPNGSEFYGMSGVIYNEGNSTVTVPDLLLRLLDEQDRVVFEVVVAPGDRKLLPGYAMIINEEFTDVPRSAFYAEIGWAP